MPTEGTDDVANVHQGSEFSEFEEQVEIERETIRLVDPSTCAPSGEAYEHAWLWNEVRSPGENSVGPSTGAAYPQLLPGFVYVATGAVGHRCGRVQLEGSTCQREGPWLQEVVIPEPVDVSDSARSRVDPCINGPCLAARIEYPRGSKV